MAGMAVPPGGGLKPDWKRHVDPHHRAAAERHWPLP